MMAMATSGTMIAKRVIPSICSDCEFDIQMNHINTFCDALKSDESDLILGNNHIGVEFKGGKWIGLKLEEKFPSQMALKMFLGDMIEVGSMMPSDLIPHLEICKRFAQDKWIPVNINLSEKGALVHFSTTDTLDYNYSIHGNFQNDAWKANSLQLFETIKCFKPDSKFTIRHDDVKHYLTDGVVDVILQDVRM